MIYSRYWSVLSAISSCVRGCKAMDSGRGGGYLYTNKYGENPVAAAGMMRIPLATSGRISYHLRWGEASNNLTRVALKVRTVLSACPLALGCEVLMKA